MSGGRQSGQYLSRRTQYFFIMIAATGGLAVLLMWWYIFIHPHISYRWAMGFLVTLLYLGVFPLLYLSLIRPFRETERMMSLFASGYSLEGVSGLEWQLSPGTERVVQKFSEVLQSEEAMNLTKRQAQFLAMQNQINPHFLYNTLEGIRGEALASGNVQIARMTETLAEFFRYTITNLENLVTLDDELSNVRNYYAIQQFRFGDRLNLSILFENDEEKNQLRNAKVPKLILQPIVENAIIHGLEEKMERGQIRIRILCTGKRLILTVSDNGVGIEKRALAQLNDKIHNVHARYMRSKDRRGGIALANVNSRIRLLFGEDYGIAVFSMKERGTDVEITLPWLTRRMDTEMDEAPESERP